jgi:Amt family ammonium transporter
MNQADTAWMLISTALVLLMTPALAFFYGGLVRSKNALNTMMMSFISLGFVGILWALVGYSLALSPGGNDYLGDLRFAFLNGVGLEAKDAVVPLTIPHMLYMAFQATFCIITAALISGAIVERMRFSAYLLFISLWSLVVYAPMAHWVWGGGWLADMGAWDFAGGTVVHVNAGAAALVAAMVVGKRSDYGQASILPHNIPTVLLGAGLLWFGWFGFNAGSAVAASPIAALAFVTTMLAPAATLVVWTFLDMMRSGKPTAVGCATAIVVGLVAITPAAGFISPMSAIALGAIAAVPSYLALIIRAKTSLGRFARRGRGSRRRRYRRRDPHRRLRGEEPQRRVRRPHRRQPGSSGHPGDGGRDGHCLQRRDELHSVEDHRALPPAARHAVGRGDGSRRDDARRGSYLHGGGE